MQVKDQQALVIGEEVYFLSGKNEWQIGTVVGTRYTGRSYDILTHEGTLLRRNRSHLKPRSFDIPIISQYFASRTLTLSQSEIFSEDCTKACNQTHMRYCLWLLYFRDILYPEECHQAQEADEVYRGPTDQCQHHTCEEDKATPPPMDHHYRRPGLADTNKVVISQGRYELKPRPQR